MNILIVAGLSDFKLGTKLLGLYKNDQVEKIFLIRKIPLKLKNKKVINVNPSFTIFKYSLIFEVWKAFIIPIIILKENIKYIYAIQLMPHSFLTAFYSFILKKKLILSVIGSDIHIQIFKPYLKTILRLILKQASIVTTLGSQSRNNLIQAGLPENKTFLLLEYINANKFKPIKIEKKWDLIYVGSLIPVKDLPCLIDAIAQVKKLHKNITLCIVGSGSEKNTLEKLIASLSLTNNIDCIKHTSNVEIYLNKSQIFIMTSKSEGLPAAALEAMYCGLPVILPAVGDIPGFFNKYNNAVIYEKSNVKQLSKGILDLTQNISHYKTLRKNSQQASLIYKQNWGLSQQIEKWDEIFAHLDLTDQTHY